MAVRSYGGRIIKKTFGLDFHQISNPLSPVKSKWKERLKLTGEANSACAVVPAGHVLAYSSIHAGVGLALVVINIAVVATPARVAGTFIASQDVK